MRVEDPVFLQRHRVALVLGVGELNLIPGLKRPMPAKTHVRKGIGARTPPGPLRSPPPAPLPLRPEG
ncbi:hypothetical protein Plo01_33500 [Planobispora longispora]|uniref:Uncharacterized protein n=1 Tax=Planobispora longispora TaxID=28887 RepID=A0A8J3W6L0_9ACTN|nr:hypothetical protein Plo01_33500 [Planobispora longispora]